MSKNLSNGFKFNTTDIMVIHKCIQDFRELLTPMVYDKTTQYFAEETSLMYDTNTLNNAKSHGIFNETYQKFIQKQDEVRVKAIRDPSVDFQFSITVIPTNGAFYGLFYTEQTDFADLWAELGLVKEFAWYNHTTRPETYSEEQWKTREDIWDTLLESTGGVPALSGFTYSVIQAETTIVPKITDVLRIIPSITDRTSLMARDNMFKRFCKDITITQNTVMDTYNDFVDYMDTDKGKKNYDDEIGRMSSRLKLILTEQEIM